MYCIVRRHILPSLAEEERQSLLTQAHLHTLVEMLEAIPDPRGKHGLRYDLPYLLTCLIAALLCNCQSTEAVSQWCREQVDLLRDLFGPRLFFTPKLDFVHFGEGWEVQSHLRGKIEADQSKIFLRRKPMPLPDPIREVLATFRPLFPAPTWRKLMTLLTGTRLSQGRRTVAAALRHSGNSMAGNWRNFHQVLNRARWSPFAMSRHLLLLIVETFVPVDAWVDLVIDETLERRWGGKISKRGHSRDSALSSRERSVNSPGWRWMMMAVVLTLPWTKQKWALPFLCVLATTRRP